MDSQDRGSPPVARGRTALEPVTLDLRTRSTELRSIINDCSLRWFLDQTVPEDEHGLVSYFELGTQVHAAIEFIIEHGLEWMELHEVIDMYQVKLMESFKEADFILFSGKRPDKETCLLALDDLIMNWFDLVHPQGRKRHPIFETAIWPPRTEVYMEDTEHHIFSTADAIYDYDDGMLDPRQLIVDWKTGMGKKADDLQLWFYYYIGRKQGHIDPESPFEGVFVHLTHGDVQWAKPYPGDSYMDALLKRARWIKTEGSFIPEPGWYCKYCPWYETHCPLYTTRELDEVLNNYSVVIE